MWTSVQLNNIQIVQKVLMRAIEKFKFEPLCEKSYEYYVNCAMTTHQIWLCDMTVASKSENCYLSPTPPSAYRVNKPSLLV